MDRNTPFPNFPDPRRDYDFRWASDLIRALDQMSVLLRNPGQGRFTTLTLTNLPTNDIGLENGSLWLNGNVLCVSLLNMAIPQGTQATASVGNVTVTTL